MFIKYFRLRIYLAVAVVLYGTSFGARAGSYEDFFIAVRNDNVGTVAELLQRGFDPNSHDAKGQTGLTIAMQEHSPKATRLLLAAPGINVNELNLSGESPLMMAALKGDLAGAQLLLERGAQVNLPGWSPLLYAATGPEPKMVALMLERGADINAASPNGSTALMMAAQYGSEDSVQLLLDRGADPKRRNQKDLGAAEFAQIAGRDALAKRLEALAR